MSEFDSIEAWNHYEREMKTVSVKRIYVKIAGGWVAGAILSRLRYFESPTKDGSKRRRAGIERNGLTWVVRSSADWEADLYMTPGEFAGGLKALRQRGLVWAETHFFNKKKALYLRIDEAVFLALLNDALSRSDIKPATTRQRRTKPQDNGIRKSQNNGLLDTKPQDNGIVETKPLNNAVKISVFSSVSSSSEGSASDANAPTPPPPAQPSKPSRSKGTRTQTPIQAEVESVPPPPATPEQAAAADELWQAVEAAPPEARQPTRASGTSKDAIERAIGDVCFRTDKDLRRANIGVIRKVGADIRAMNADLETPITAELIYLVFEDSGYWQRHYMSLDETTNTRRLPTPGVVGKHTLNILAWGKGQTQVQTSEEAIRQAIALNERVLGNAPDVTQPPTTTRRLTRPPVMSLVRPLSQTA